MAAVMINISVVTIMLLKKSWKGRPIVAGNWLCLAMATIIITAWFIIIVIIIVIYLFIYLFI